MHTIAASTPGTTMAPSLSDSTWEQPHILRILGLTRRLASDAVNQPDLASLLRTVIAWMSDVLDNRAVGIIALDETIGECLAVVHHPLFEEEILPMPQASRDTLNQLDKRRPLLIHPGQDTHSATIWTPIFERYPIESLITIPLCHQGQPLGVLGIEGADQARTDELADTLMLLIADQLALAIVHLSQRALADRLAFAARIGRLFTEVLDLARLTNEIVICVHSLFEGCQVALWLADDESLVCRAVAGIPMILANTQLPLSRDHMLVWSYHHGEPVLVEQFGHRVPYQDPVPLEIVLPLIVGGHVLGVLDLQRPQPGHWSSAQLDVLAALADQAALAIHYVELRAQNEQNKVERASVKQQGPKAEKLRVIGELAAGVVHDFNNLLSIIIGHAELLTPTAPQHFSQSRRAILQAAQDGARTVRRMQHFLNTPPEPQIGPLDLTQLVEDVLQFTRPRWRDAAQEHGISISVHQRLRNVPLVLANATEIREIAINLIFNAVDAMPAGGTLTLATGCDEQSSWLEVRDTGSGIAPELIERIFEPFFTTKGEHGNGMGLAIARNIARQHGGDLVVESNVGRGSCFRIILPIAPQQILGVLQSTTDLNAPIRPLRILLVEDNHEVRAVLLRLLEMEGHFVRCARSAEEALQFFQPGVFQVVCSDLGMPGMNGWELLNHVRALDSQLITVLLSGWGGQLDHREAKARGVDFILPKPIDVVQLHAVLAQIAHLVPEEMLD